MRRVILSACLGAVLAVLLFALSCSKDKAPTAPLDTPPACALSATSLNFGAVLVGSSADQSITISNTGGGTLAGTATTASPGYAVVGGASYSLAAGQQATITVRFTPTTTGTQSGTVSLSNSACGSVACTGTGQQSGSVCRLSTTVLDFGSVPPGVCAYSDRVFTISNAGAGVLSGTVTSPCAAFQILGNPTYSLGPGASSTFTVRFSPTSFGDQRCRIATGCDTLTCIGHTEGVTACARLFPTSLDFGTVYLGQTVTKTASFTAGPDPFYLRWVSGGDMNFDASLPVGRIDSGEMFNLAVRFSPQSEGQHASWYRGECNPLIGDGNYHAFGCLTVSGIGMLAPGTPQCQLSATSLDFGSVTVGSSTTRTLTVTNVGGGVLNGTASDCTPFAVVGDPTISLGPGQSKTLTIRFAPPERGHAYSCYLHLADPVCEWVYLTGQGM